MSDGYKPEGWKVTLTEETVQLAVLLLTQAGIAPCNCEEMECYCQYEIEEVVASVDGFVIQNSGQRHHVKAVKICS